MVTKAGRVLSQFDEQTLMDLLHKNLKKSRDMGPKPGDHPGFEAAKKGLEKSSKSISSLAKKHKDKLDNISSKKPSETTKHVTKKAASGVGNIGNAASSTNLKHAAVGAGAGLAAAAAGGLAMRAKNRRKAKLAKSQGN